MKPAQHEQAQRLFEEAICGGTPDPAAWVTTQTGDELVLSEVRRLLDHHRSSLTHAEAPPAVKPVRIADSLIGKTLGGYCIERLLGAGGMGRVYLARQTTGSCAEVALKVLGRATSSPIALQRFAREIEVMKQLSHPGIASFLAGGMYDDGEGAVPWFAMEHVANATDLALWCDEKQLNQRQRLSLIAEIADAIGHAHGMGIVHRDLKPANILVNSAGDAKVIDFGVARCVADDFGVGSIRTQTGQLVGTMQYMSPEQFEGDPRKIDQRADVYALGVLVWELITGTYPHDVRVLSVSDAARTVCEQDAADIRSVNVQVAPEIADIIAKCLRRDRSKRYDDARQLGKALRAFLRGESGISNPHEKSARASSIARGASQRGDQTPSIRNAVKADAPLRSSGWLVPTLTITLVAAIVLVAMDIVKPKWFIQQWKSMSASTDTAVDLAAITEPISVDSDPPGAQVTIDEAVVGLTPLHTVIAWKTKSQSATVVISKSQFQPQTHVISAAPRGGRTAPLAMRVRLDPVTVSPNP